MFEEEIKKLNPGRKIEVHKICPYLKDICIKYKCNAYAEHFETNIVTLEDKISHADIGFNWELDLDKRGWKFKCGSTSNSVLNDPDSLYFKKQEKEYYGRCLV